MLNTDKKTGVREKRKTLKRGLITLLVMVATAAVPQAVSHANPTKGLPASPTEEPQEVREEFRQSYPLSASGRIILENLNGAARIKVWDREEVEVVAAKRAFSRERLDEVKIDITATAELVRIRTRYPSFSSYSREDKSRQHEPATVDYTLTVPRKVRLESIELVNGPIEIDGVEGYIKASSVNGRVTARGMTSDSRLSTVNGSLEASFGSLAGTTQINLGSVNGNVSLVIPSNSNAQIRAATVHGAIRNDFGLEVHDLDYVGHELNGQIGTGGPRIRLGNVNGAISVRHDKSGAVSPATTLLSQKEKDKEKFREEVRMAREDARKGAQAAREEAMADLAQERLERQREIETKREIDRRLREAEREIRTAQVQVEREQRRVERERQRSEGRGTGAGEGEGTGGGIGGGVGSGVSRFTAKETKTFTVSGTPRVHITTHDGVVLIRGWDRPEVKYTATKRAGDDAELSEISIKAEQVDSNVTIVTEPDSNGSVSFELYVPRNTSLEAATGDGQLSLDGVSGDITLRSGDGPVNVANASGQLNVSTGDGPIKILRFDGGIEARTGDGPVSLDGRFTEVQVNTGSGSVTLAVPADLNFVIETNAEDLSNEGLPITEEPASSKRLKRWKVGQGGKVFVITTGDGRVFLRTR